MTLKGWSKSMRRPYRISLGSWRECLARLRDNYENLAEDVENLDQEIGNVGDQDTAVGAEFFIEELIQEIRQKGLRVGNWFLKEDNLNDHFILYDSKRGGWYKFHKTVDAHVIQGI